MAELFTTARLTFFCDAGGVRVSLPQEWTDRGPEPAGEPVSAESLAALRELVDLLACRRPDPGEAGIMVTNLLRKVIGWWHPEMMAGGRVGSRRGDGRGEHGRVVAGRCLR